MGKYVKGQYVYSMEDCHCSTCLHVDRKTGMCKISECCCREEKREALLHFPPDGYERKKGRAKCRG